MAPRRTDLRLAALRRFAIAITVLNVLGHTVLGFEQSVAQPLVGAARPPTRIELLLESIERVAPAGARRASSAAARRCVDFLLSAHITGLAVAMLLYANDRLRPIAFAAAVAIGSKYAVPGRGSTARTRHFFNPSNFGITATLLPVPLGRDRPALPCSPRTSRAAGRLVAAAGHRAARARFLNARFTGGCR